MRKKVQGKFRLHRHWKPCYQCGQFGPFTLQGGRQKCVRCLRHYRRAARFDARLAAAQARSEKARKAKRPLMESSASCRRLFSD